MDRIIENVDETELHEEIAEPKRLKISPERSVMSRGKIVGRDVDRMLIIIREELLKSHSREVTQKTHKRISHNDASAPGFYKELVNMIRMQSE